MVCYVVPTIAAIIHGTWRKNNTKNNLQHSWLALLLSGGAIFGLVDHLWNRELFLIGPNILSDLLLGITITLTIFVVWGVIVFANKLIEKSSVKDNARNRNLQKNN